MDHKSTDLNNRHVLCSVTDCQTCALRDSVLFAGLNATDFDSVHAPIEQFTLKPDATLYHTGEQEPYLFTVRSGALKLVQYLADGGVRIVRLARASDVLGLEVLVGDCYQHDAVALQMTEICRLPTRLIRHLGHDNPALHRELMRRWQRALSEADVWLTQLSTGAARQRVARLLLRLIQLGDPPVCQLFSRENVGAMLGITTETASRTIAGFKREELVQEINPNTFVLNVALLQRIAEE